MPPPSPQPPVDPRATRRAGRLRRWHDRSGSYVVLAGTRPVHADSALRPNGLRSGVPAKQQGTNRFRRNYLSGQQGATAGCRSFSCVSVSPVAYIYMNTSRPVFSAFGAPEWWVHLAGAFRVHLHRHWANHPPQKDRGSDDGRPSPLTGGQSGRGTGAAASINGSPLIVTKS